MCEGMKEIIWSL